jgi:hypothetical protein
MEKITVYGLPLNPTHLLEQLDGGSFCVSFGTRQKLGKQLDQAIRLVGENGILLVDNGAYSEFQKALAGGADFAEAGKASMADEYLDGFEAWAKEILDRCPQAVAVIPDVIGGTPEQNAELLRTSNLPIERSMAMWHTDEPIECLLDRCTDYEWVGIGSAPQHKPGSDAWHARMTEVFAAIDKWEAESEGAYVRPRIHLMRAQQFAHLYPVDSSDSTNLAVNHCRAARSGKTVAMTAARIDGKIQSSAGPASEHQLKRPLLGHVEFTAWRQQLMAELWAEHNQQKGERAMAKTWEQWRDLVTGATRGYTQEEIEQVATLCVEAEARGEKASVWHMGSIVRGHDCCCADCEAQRKAA